MDTLFLLPLCMLTGIALPLGGLWVVGRRAWRPLAVAQAYRRVSHDLGLEVDTRGVSVHGYLGAQPLYVGEVLEGHGTHRRLELRGILGFERPLGWGLMIRRRTGKRWFRPPPTASVATKDERFDKRFEVFCHDPEIARALLGDPVKAALFRLADRWPDLLVTDHHIRVRLGHPEPKAERLLELIDTMRRLERALQTSRRSLPPPPPLEPFVSSWRNLSEELSLTFEPWLPALTGSLSDTLGVLLAPRCTEGIYSAELQLTFDRPHDLGLILKPQHEPDGYWSVGQDIQVGQPEFDAAFVIKGYDPTAVRRLLDEDNREALLRLVRRGLHVELTDRRLRIRGIPLEPLQIREVIEEARETTEGLRAPEPAPPPLRAIS